MRIDWSASFLRDVSFLTVSLDDLNILDDNFGGYWLFGKSGG